MADWTWPITSISIMIAITALGILMLWRITKERKSGFPLADERSKKISGRAATYATNIGSYFILAFLAIKIFAREIYDVHDIDAGYPMIAALLVYNISFIILRLYLDRKGD